MLVGKLSEWKTAFTELINIMVVGDIVACFKFILNN